MKKLKCSFLKPFTILWISLIVLTTTACSSDKPIPEPEEEEEEMEEPVILNRLPLVSITTNGNEIVDEPKIDASFSIYLEICSVTQAEHSLLRLPLMA